jgi:hypothetical protein
VGIVHLNLVPDPVLNASKNDSCEVPFVLLNSLLINERSAALQGRKKSGILPTCILPGKKKLY